MKYLNVAIFVVLSAIYLLFSSNIKISTNFMDALFSKESIKIFEVSKKLGYSNEILISHKGFDTKSLDKLEAIKQELLKIPIIKKVDISLTPSLQMQEYFQKNYYLLADFNSAKLSNAEIQKKLKSIYDNIYSSMIYQPLNSNDPLELFTLDVMESDEYLKLDNYGYILKAKTVVDSGDADESRKLYKEVHTILESYPDTVAFAPFFFLVENSAYIKNDVTTIILFSSILLLILYFFILRSYRLFFHTIIAIGSSILSAMILSSLVFDSINIMALAFGISITTISIDYMFHYYFHNDFSKKGFINQRRVLFGFITTFGVFMIFSLIDIKLFAQLSLFSAISLATAYLIFSYTFGHLNIVSPNVETEQKQVKSFNPLYIFIISFLMLGYSYVNLEFDKNLRNLDYQNVKLLDISQRFIDSLKKDRYHSLILSAKSEELLLQKYEEVAKKYSSALGIGKFVFSQKKCSEKLHTIKEYDFAKLRQTISKEAKEVGFKDVFGNSYAGVDSIKCDMKVMDDMGFSIIKHEGLFYTLALVDKSESVVKSEGVEILNMGEILSNDIDILKDKLLKFIFISIAFIIVILFSITRFDILYPLSYILFPISVVLFAISLFSELNIMHMFALIILVAIGIDYGIYMHKTTTLVQTKIAIKYALLSTFAGFGVLIFSSVNSLYSIGFVITIGIASIFILLFYKRDI